MNLIQDEAALFRFRESVQTATQNISSNEGKSDIELESGNDQSSHSAPTIGFVPTMGALHEGHLSLMRRALDENDLLVVSIYVNPTQFDNPDDLDHYPRTLDRDLELLKTLEADDRITVFLPRTDEVYPKDQPKKSYTYDGLEHQMEGKSRPGHFDGVGMILEYLFTRVRPHRAYFGEKDFQQLMIVQNLEKQLNLDIEIIGCAISREPSGLARSSRNSRLTAKGREDATFLQDTLQQLAQRFKTDSIPDCLAWVHEQFNENRNCELEYITIASTDDLKPARSKQEGKSYRAFLVAHVEDVRLIDNIAL